MEHRGFKKIWKSNKATCRITLVEWKSDRFTLEIKHLDRGTGVWHGVSTTITRGEAKRLRKLLEVA